MNICFLGLSQSGKTCYIYAACDVLSSGLTIDNHVVSITCTSIPQQIRLNKGIEDLADKIWPTGSGETITYPFELKIDGTTIGEFSLYDYRGGMLYSDKDDDQDERNELLNTFEDSSCIVFFIDGETLLNALPNEMLSPEHQNKLTFSEQKRAVNRIKFIDPLLRICNERMESNVPILLSITKRDLFSSDELKAGLNLLRRLLPSIFSENERKIVGITSITLGENLGSTDDGRISKISGNLNISPEGNIHIPFLFALFHNANKYNCNSQTLSVIEKIRERTFSPEKIRLYIGGKEAIII